MSLSSTVDPFAAFVTTGNQVRLTARGAWTAPHIDSIDEALVRLPRQRGSRIEFDLSGVERLDTSGAWVLVREHRRLEQAGATVSLSGLSDAHAQLLQAVAERSPKAVRRARPQNVAIRLVAEAGETVVTTARDVVEVASFMGSAVASLGRLALRPWRFRFTSVVHHLEHTGLRAVPIVILMAMLVGAIVAQQGAFQLRRFGAEIFTINLVAVLTLREVGVLLTAIMVAGRSGSAITAEIGSMKMREEIDALKVFGLDLVEVLVLPRLFALMIALPILVFIADLAAIAGAGFVAWTYIGIPPEAFIVRVREAVDAWTLAVGLIKAPFMALVIGVIACIEGLSVEGSAELLGRHTTASVVKAIFMMIVLDGLFAVFFAAVNF